MIKFNHRSIHSMVDNKLERLRGFYMEKRDIRYLTYIDILNEELIPAMGCTEPIALAYGAAKAREILGCQPDKVKLEVSGSIIKNVKSVIVPNTNHLKGIPAAAAAGIIAGKSEKQLEVIADVTDDEIQSIKKYLEDTPIDVEMLDGEMIFDMMISVEKGESYVKVRISEYHTNIVYIEKDGEIIFKKNNADDDQEVPRADRSLMDMESIWEFANVVDLDDVRILLQRQIDYNTAIVEEGLRGDYGANIGKVLLATYGEDVRTRAKAYAAAGSDARMNGCEMPVIINSGSGNQGITCSIPVIEYAKTLKAGDEKLLRALVLSNLVAIYQKNVIGTLSAFCGAVSAGAAAGAGIAYLCGGGYKEVIHTVVNALAIVSGIVCDGAKASCAAKIASSVDAAILGYNMYKMGQQFRSGDGLVMNGVEATIRSIGHLGKEGMKETNNEIIKMMMNG